MTISRNTILIIVFGLVILAAAAYLIFGRSSVGPAVGAGPAKSDAEETFTNLTAEINNLKFDVGILTDIRFKSLIDIHTEIVPEPEGRKDPFAPLGR